MSEVSAFGFTAHYSKPGPSHQTGGKSSSRENKGEAWTPAADVPDKDSGWTASTFPGRDTLPGFGQIFHPYSGNCSQ